MNHFITHSDASSNILINSCKSLEKAEMVLSSAKLCKSVVLNQRNRSLMKMLKRIGPNMEPCGIPESNYLMKRLYVLLILTFCLLTSLEIEVEKRETVFTKAISMQFRKK